MEQLGKAFALGGWILRSGGADGADSAFERGCDSVVGKKEIFLPYKNFNQNQSRLIRPTEQAKLIAKRLHPAWDHCSFPAKMLHARNVHQVLGENLDDPVNLVICWTRGGGKTGGTATAMKVAAENRIEIVNLYDQPFEYLRLLELAHAA